MRLLSILTACLVISFSLLFFNRLTISERILTDKLKTLGAQNVQVSVSELNTSKLTVASLTATFNKNLNKPHVQLENGILHFSLIDLIMGKIADLRIDTLQISLGKWEKKEQKSFSHQTIRDLLEQDLLPPYLPEKISIHKLIFSGPGTTPLTGKPLQLETQTLDSGLSAILRLPEKKISIETMLTRLSNGTTQLQLDGYQAEAQLFHLSLQQKHAETMGKLTTLLDTCNVVSPLLPFSLPDISGKLEIQFSARYILKNSMEMEMIIDSQGLSLPGLEIDSLTGKIALHADNLNSLTFHQGSHIYISDIQSPAASLKKLYFQFSGHLAKTPQQLAFSLSHDSRLLTEDFRKESFHVKYAEMIPALNIILGPHKRAIALLPEFTTVIKELQVNRVTIPEMHLSPEKTLSLALLPGTTARWNIGGGKIIAEVDTLGFQDLHMFPTGLTVDIPDQKNMTNPLQFRCRIHNKEMLVKWKEQSIPLKDIQANLTTNKRNLQLSVSLSHANVPGDIQGILSHDFHYSTGNAVFSTVSPLDLRDEQTRINELINGVELPFSISSALIDSTISLQWVKNEPLFVNSRFHLTDGIAEFDNVTLTGVTIQQELQLFPQIRSLASGHIFINEMNTGLKISNILINNQLSPASTGFLPIVLVDSVEANILGGKISSKKLLFDPSHPDMDIAVRVDGVKLEDIINLNKLNGLSVTGILDGNISIQIMDREIRGAKGNLASRQPGGVINYQPTMGNNAAIQQLPAYAVHALEEFHYTLLTASPLYEADGTLTIDIHTEGRSPRLNTNRPIHLNLNTSQNLLSLLQSLRYSRKLTDDLEKRLQKNIPKN